MWMYCCTWLRIYNVLVHHPLFHINLVEGNPLISQPLQSGFQSCNNMVQYDIIFHIAKWWHKYNTEILRSGWVELDYEITRCISEAELWESYFEYLMRGNDGQTVLNSLTPGDLNEIFVVHFKLILVIDGKGISCEIAFKWMSMDLTDDKSTLVQVMAWCRQATSHSLNQCCPRSVSPYGVTRPQWVNFLFFFKIDISLHFTGNFLAFVHHPQLQINQSWWWLSPPIRVPALGSVV